MTGGLIMPKVIKRIEKVVPFRTYPLSAENKNKEGFFKDLNISQIDFDNDSEDTKSEIISILGNMPNRCRKDTPPRNSNPLFKNIQDDNSKQNHKKILLGFMDPSTIFFCTNKKYFDYECDCPLRDWRCYSKLTHWYP